MADDRTIKQNMDAATEAVRQLNKAVANLADAGMFFHMGIGYNSDRRCLQLQNVGLSSIKEDSTNGG